MVSFFGFGFSPQFGNDHGEVSQQFCAFTSGWFAFGHDHYFG
jgi:hypothetical protein